ncbi:uncharacterized protein F5891DRAFT_1188697 [Suillus fuscotomentosus]|uniref:Uncharacterized protein n=1 Tax=Suillus fuscotomentosus TaxID=1912939 RepID=A0AAD4E6B0_9AGAM|nr:uncharacterized protein F5891DRAFT_1188697 [Suillus fuscotomentosus]KAG1900382.1 hypothetical protein F5891DRAFT_1188697 [Suillus fuscotomentosus]
MSFGIQYWCFIEWATVYSSCCQITLLPAIAHLTIQNNITPTLRQEFDLPVVSVRDLALHKFFTQHLTAMTSSRRSRSCSPGVTMGGSSALQPPSISIRVALIYSEVTSTNTSYDAEQRENNLDRSQQCLSFLCSSGRNLWHHAGPEPHWDYLRNSSRFVIIIVSSSITYPDAEPRGGDTYELFLLDDWSMKAMCHAEPADHFTAAVNFSALSSKFIQETYKDLTVVKWTTSINTFVKVAHE